MKNKRYRELAAVLIMMTMAADLLSLWQQRKM